MSTNPAIFMLLLKKEQNNNKIIPKLDIQEKTENEDDEDDNMLSPIFSVKGIIDGFWSSLKLL